MNITFLMGNGFDIGLGLKTKYEDFYKKYCLPDDSDNNNILDFKSMLYNRQNSNNRNSENGKIIDWSDFEKAFGEHSNDFTIDNKYAYLERFEHFITNFNAYLEEEERKLDYSAINNIASTMKKAVTTYYHIRNGDRSVIENLYRNSGSSRDYYFLSFNYTKSVDECARILKESWKNESLINVVDVHHIHGFIENNMIIGVNDASQIANPDFAQDIDVVNEIVKPRQNSNSKTNYEINMISTINHSHIICVYGMSIGATDKKWWSLIAKWLSSNMSRLLVILGHSQEYNRRFPHTQRKVVNSIIENFLSFSDLEKSKKEEIRERILVGVNHDVFEMNLRKKITQEEKEDKSLALV